MTQTVGFLLGVLASILAWYLLTRIRPHLVIAPAAAFEPSTGSLRIKVINRGRRQVAGCRARLSVMDREGGGQLLRMRIRQTLPLIRDRLFGLGARGEFGKPWGLYPAFIFRVKIEPDLIASLGPRGDSERRLVFTLVGRDALTGSEVVLRTTYGPRDVEEGIYLTGDTFEITSAPRAATATANEAQYSEELLAQTFVADAPNHPAGAGG